METVKTYERKAKIVEAGRKIRDHRGWRNARITHGERIVSGITYRDCYGSSVVAVGYAKVKGMRRMVVNHGQGIEYSVVRDRIAINSYERMDIIPQRDAAESEG